MTQYVTRKVSGTKTRFKYYDTVSKDLKEMEIMLPRRIPPDRKDVAEREVKNFIKKHELDITYLEVLSFYVEEGFYGVAFEDFMKIAVPLDNKRKPKTEEKQCQEQKQITVQ